MLASGDYAKCLLSLPSFRQPAGAAGDSPRLVSPPGQTDGFGSQRHVQAGAHLAPRALYVSLANAHHTESSVRSSQLKEESAFLCGTGGPNALWARVLQSLETHGRERQLVIIGV